MAQLEELRQLWQSQPQPGTAAVDSRSLADALRRFSRRQHFIYGAKVIVLAWQTWFCLSRLGLSTLTVAGQAIFAASAASLLLADWRDQLGIARLDFTKASLTFVDSALERLRNSNDLFRRRIWLHMVPMAVGINLLYGAYWTPSTPRHRMAAHLALSAGIFAACALGLRLRPRRFAMDYRPLKERLMAMKNGLEEQR
jgi:hypothetical protein